MTERIDERLQAMGVDTSEMTDEQKFTAATGLTRYAEYEANNPWYVPGGAANVPAGAAEPTGEQGQPSGEQSTGSNTGAQPTGEPNTAEQGQPSGESDTAEQSTGAQPTGEPNTAEQGEPTGEEPGSTGEIITGDEEPGNTGDNNTNGGGHDVN